MLGIIIVSVRHACMMLGGFFPWLQIEFLNLRCPASFLLFLLFQVCKSSVIKTLTVPSQVPQYTS